METLADASLILGNNQLYPVQAVKFLSRQNFQGNLFTDYNFAGYVLWKLPTKKDLSDGSMPSGEETSLSEWVKLPLSKIIENDIWRNFTKKMFQKYNIQYVALGGEQVSQEKHRRLL